MVKTKLIKPEGQILTIEEEPEIVEVSYTQAKKLAKKPMSDKQAANVAKMVEANRLKWEAQKKAKEEHYKKLQEEEAKKPKVLVKPKRIYPPRTKQAPKTDSDVIEFSEEDSDEESDEDVYQASKSKPKSAVSKEKVNLVKQVEKKIEEVKQQVVQQKPVSKYNGMMKSFWGF
jgi:hypothetical protein